MIQPDFETLLKELQGVPPGERPDLREPLFSLAREKRAKLQAQVTVVAGSVGKTSVKEIFGAILKTWLGEKSFSSPANKNTKIALAEQVLRLPSTCQAAVFEVGARRLRDFETPLGYLQPSVVALLNIGLAHVGEFGSKENLIKEKLSVLEAASAQSLVVPANDALILSHAVKTKKEVFTFGFSEQSLVQIVSEDLDKLVLKINSRIVVLDCPFSGAAKALNIAAAMALALATGAPIVAVQQSLQSFSGVPRRFHLFRWGGVEAIDDAFNASPESMREGLRQLRKISAGKRVLLVLGSMLELGNKSEQEHLKVADELRRLFSEEILRSQLALATVGDEASALSALALSQYRHYENSEVARSDLIHWRSEFDLIYFKGSKSIKLHRIFEEP